jgi:signal transduction histidine kinase
LAHQKHFYDLFYPDDREELKRAAFEVFAGKEAFHEFINRTVHKNGKVVWLSTSGIPIIDESGELVGYRGADIDITGRKQAEEKLQEYQQRLRALASELTLTEERERRNIAVNLHDQVGQSLAVMRVQLAVAQKESSGRKVAAILDEVSGSLRQAIQDTRNVISDLSSPLINELGLAAALSEWLKERIADRYGLEAQFIDDGDRMPLGKDTETILFRSVRELLTNVVKHANANRVSVSLQRRGSAIQIVVADDGVGLADGRHPEKDSTESGFGLFSIKERMSDLSGSLEIESHPGRGVRAILTAPLESSD